MASNKDKEDVTTPCADAIDDKPTELYEAQQVKAKLDDAATESLFPKRDHWKEDVGASNLKLILMTSAIASAALAHFHPTPFPQNWKILLACVTYYFAISSFLQIIASYTEWNMLLQLYDERPGGIGMRVGSHIDVEAETYTVGVSPLPRGSLFALVTRRWTPNAGLKEHEKWPAHYERTWSITQFFDEEGYFHEGEAYEAIGAFWRAFDEAGGLVGGPGAGEVKKGKSD